MTVEKNPIDTARIRRPPPTGFGWVDRRFVRDGHIVDLPREAVTLYFFLAAVADAQGLSFYADPTLAKLLKLDHSDLLYARTCLLRAGLIAYRYPLYQILALPPSAAERTRPLTRTARQARVGAPEHIADILDTLLADAPPATRSHTPPRAD
jgi:hypothetical protein